MESSNARAGPAQHRRPESSSRVREDASDAFNSLTSMQRGTTEAIPPLVNRLHLSWPSVPATKQAKLYSPSTTQVPNNSSRPANTGASSNKQTLAPIAPTRKSSVSTRKHSRTSSADVAAFEQNYASEDPLMRYVLHVIRTGSPVRRAEIPRGKHLQRKVRPEEDVLFLLHCEAPPCGFHNAYWLTFADEGSALHCGHGVEYFTLGSHGLTRFKDGQGIEFSDLAGWVDEKRAFDQMTNMKGLKRIELVIFFFSWKRRTVQRRLYRVRERLACSLFTCHPIAGRLLMNVRDMCMEIEREAERDYIETDTSYTLERLAHIHHDRVHAAKTAITTKILAITAMIDDTTRDISRYKEGQGCSYAVTDHKAFSASLRMSSLRDRMFTFLRLVDFHVAEAVYQHVVFVVQDLRVRICGQSPMTVTSNSSCNSSDVANYAGVVERRINLWCRSEVAGDNTGEIQSLQGVLYTVQVQESDASVVAVPGLYVTLEDDVDFEGDVSSSTIRFGPTKVEVLELVHSILLRYCVAMDELPRVLTDKHFQHVLTPFEPSVRREFAEILLKPSHLVLESYEPELLEMRAALNLHFRRIGILQQEHLRCVRAIKVAERESPMEATTRRGSITNFYEDQEEQEDEGEDEDEESRLPELPDLSTSAAAYELAQKTWNRFVQYADNAAPMLQVGYLLLDQRSFVDRLRCHVSKCVAEMDDALPLIYQQFLAGLLKDVDGRIEKVTKIPTNLAEANTWLAQVTSMMATHPFRQRLDAKIANLARLRILVKARGLLSLEADVQDSIHKIELTWESVIETLLLCLARVEERGSEHRRSVHDVITKVDEYIARQLHHIIKMFEGVPSGCEEEEDSDEEAEDKDDGIASNTASHSESMTTKDMVQQLEDLVAMDLERKNVVQQFEDYDREHRAIMDMPPTQHAVWTSNAYSENLSAVSLADKLPSELLLLYIITSLELRQWFGSWKKLQDKWLGTPITGVHPGIMINRIKQFRRRLVYASSRLSRLSSVLLQTLPFDQNPLITQQSEDEEDLKECAPFAKKDFELIRVFDESIEEMLNCNRVFQAMSGGAFSEARWAAVNQLLNLHSASTRGSHLTLRLMKEKCGPSQIDAFLKVCDECIVETKLHVKLEQIRQRLARIHVRVEETNYSVRCEGIAEALAQLDEIAVDLKLCLFGQNPELKLCLELRAELEGKVAVCEHILCYQAHWRLRCEATKLHEVDEYFSKRFNGSGDFALPRVRKQQKAGLKQEQTIWQAFLDASHGWSDRLRRLFFVSPQQPQVVQKKTNQLSLLGRKSAIPTASTASAGAGLPRQNTATKSMTCTLDGVMESFEGFDFEANFAACEQGIELVQSYLESLREKTPRLYCLDETSMLRLLLRDSDVEQLHQSLAICFPRVHRFAISRATNRIGSTIESFGKPELMPLGGPSRVSNTDGTIVIVGLEGVQTDADTLDKTCHFRLSVAKIGRVKFWFTRLEEEMLSLVLTDLKRAFEWAAHDFDNPEFAVYDSLLPQSIVTGSGLRFTFEMNRALRSDQHQLSQQLHQLHDAVNKRLGRLVSTRRGSSSVRGENLILLSTMQVEVVHHVAELIEEGHHEDALFFWSMQFHTRAFVETVSMANPTVQPSPGKHSKLERSELHPAGSDFLKGAFSNRSGQSTILSVCCQVAHLQMPLGQEFVGWTRLAIVSPFTQRCSYALFSALRMHHTALVVPYNVCRTGTDPTSLLWGIAQMLLRPCIEFSCSPNAGAASVHHLGNLMNATIKLNGFLIIRFLLQLTTALVGVVQEQMLQHFHQAPRGGNLNAHHAQLQAATNSLLLLRQYGGLSYGASAIFVPLDSTEDLHQSGLVQSIRMQFRAVAVSRPAIKYVVECMLLADGFVAEQIRELNVIPAFEAIANGEAGPICALNVEGLILRVVHEARRLRECYHVVWDVSPSATGGYATKVLLQKRRSSTANGATELRDGQFVFRQALNSAIKTISIEQSKEDELTEHLNVLLARAFPLSTGGRFVPKTKGDEEAVAAAVSIYLESALSLPTDCDQFPLIMELWRALQAFPAALVYGSPGCGKTTCITALHRALVALELSKQTQENEDGGLRSTQSSPVPQLVVLNPQLQTLAQFYSSIATACEAGSSNESTHYGQNSGSLRWVHVDGDVDGGILDRLLECDNRACSSVSSLPSSSLLYRGQNCSVLSGDCSDASDGPRLLFEVTSLANLSPSALRRCWALHVPALYITVASIMAAWRSRWENELVFPPDSRGSEAMTIVFKTVGVLVSTICVDFVVEVMNHDQVGDARGAIVTGGLRLGCLMLNHITQTALTLVSCCCFQNKSLLQELSYFRLVELIAFAVLWGFAGHLSDPFKLKLENYVRVKSKEHSETKHLADLPRGLLDASHFEDVWGELQPKLATSSAAHSVMTNSAKREVKVQSAFDSSNGQVLVLVPAAAALIRVCTVLLHSSQSFLLIGPAASGKTSLLRWLMHRNRETEAAEMKIETSLDERHVHGILNWTNIPAAWFHPVTESDGGTGSRVKTREETELFAGRSRHAFVFLDDLDASGEVAGQSQVQFVRTMLDQRLGYSTKHGGFRSVEKQIGAGMRLDESQSSISPVLMRCIRHFVVLRTPTYAQKELLSVFRVKYRQYFKTETPQLKTDRRLSTTGGMGGEGQQQLLLEEVVLRASVDFAVEMAAFQQLARTEHPCLYLLNLHHVNTLLERTLAFATSISGFNTTANEGTTLVQLGKVHQSWLSELQNVFLSNSPREAATVNLQSVKVGDSGETSGGDMQTKISMLLRNLSEKYFSVAFRGDSAHNFPVSMEALHYLVKLAEHHVQAPLLQPRLIQVRELLNEHMTAASGVSRRTSDQARGAFYGTKWTTSPAELVSSILLEIAATSTSSDAGNGKASRPYSNGLLTAIEMKLTLNNSWCLTQATHLIHALSQQQQIVVSSSSRYSWQMSEKLLRFACDLQGYKVHIVDTASRSDQILQDYHKQIVRLVLRAAGVRQERVALWIRERQISSDHGPLVNIIQELCLGKVPSVALLPGGEELRDDLMLSCIQSRKQLQLVTETELLAEFQQRLQQNFRLCILEESEDDQRALPFVRWMKTRPSCHWRRLDFSAFELQRLVPEVAKAALTSSPLCGVAWDTQQIAKYVALCQNVHVHMMRASRVTADPPSQLEFFLSFMANTTTTYQSKLQWHQEKIARLQTALETLIFARDKVVPTLERLKQEFELKCTRIDNELENIILQQECRGQDSCPIDGNVVDKRPTVESDEGRWALHSHYEELMMATAETKLRLEETSRSLDEWHLVAERMEDLFMKWTQELVQEQSTTEYEIMSFALCVGAQCAYSHVTSLSTAKRGVCMSQLYDLIFKNDAGGSSAGLDTRLIDGLADDDKENGYHAVAHLIWTSRFSFLCNPDIYRIVRLADELCDRVPVFVDPSGVFQRFLVHTFSGHTLFSSLPGCGDEGDVDSEHPSASKESMVISCNDPKLEMYLNEAQRLGVPVLLVNFRSADEALLDRLQPFLGHARVSHAPPRRPILRELTLKYYEDQRHQKQRRTSITMAAMAPLAQTIATDGRGVEMVAKRTVRESKHKALTIDPALVAAAVSASNTLNSGAGDVAKTPDRRRKQTVINEPAGCEHSFQIYAVTTTSVPLKVQHALAAQFAHFSVSLSESEMEAFFELPRIGKMQQPLLQELRGEYIGLADCWVKLTQNRAQLNQLLVALKPNSVDNSPFAARTTNVGITIQLQERYCELAFQLAKEHQAELVRNSREQYLREKNDQLTVTAKVFAPMAIRLVGITQCMTIMSSLAIGLRTSPFYLHNARYLGNAAVQQLAVQDDGTTQVLVHGLEALITRISSGFVTCSHHQLFCFLESIQQHVQTNKPSMGEELTEALVWLLTSRVRRESVKDASSFDLAGERRQGLEIFPVRQNSLRWPADFGASLVDRLRRRVKLCAYLFNGWKAPHSNNKKQLKAPRHNSTVQMPVDLEGSHSGSAESKELGIEQLQQQLDNLLVASERLWYEWKTTKVRLQLDVERLTNDLGYRDAATSSFSERNNAAMFSTTITLINLEELCARYQVDAALSIADEGVNAWQHALVPLLLAKTYFPSSFAQSLDHYLKLYGTLQTLGVDTTGDDGPTVSDEVWTAWPPPPSLVVDVAPLRGKHSRAHLPRALIVYAPDERSNVELKLSAWGIAVFVDTDPDNIALREELIMLITTKHKFVLELLDSKHAEAALTLVSQLINEHALLSVPEWYVLASFTIATAIENGKLLVMDRIVVFSPSSRSRLLLVGRERGHSRTTEQVVKHKLVEEYGASDSVASALTLAVLDSHDQVEQEPKSSVVLDLEELVLHISSIEDVAINGVDRENMTRGLHRLLTKGSTHDGAVPSGNDATRSAMLSSELLSDLLSVGDSAVAILTDELEEEWLSRHSVNDGQSCCDQLWTSFCQVEDLFKSLQVANSNVDPNEAAQFFPWQPFDVELTQQFSAFKAVHKHLSLLRVQPTTTTSHSQNRQQQLSSLAQGYLSFEWAESFFAGTAWPCQASGAVSVAQLLLLIVCRVGVLVRCLRGDRAWSLNLGVVSDAFGFLRCLRSYAASRLTVSESSLMLVLELDSSSDVVDTGTEEDNKRKKKALAIAKQLGAMCGVNSDWHGAVLSAVESWGVRVEGLVLLVEQESSTKLHPLPMCRIMCQRCIKNSLGDEAPLVLLPSLSPYQPAPTISQEADDAVCLVLGRSINSVVDMEENSSNSKTTHFAVGLPIFSEC